MLVFLCLLQYHHFTEDIQTRQYRSVEVLLGADYYCSTDIWSTACLIFELATGDYLFDPHAGKTYTRDEDHLGHIMELLGPIPEEIWRTSKYGAKYFSENGQLKCIPTLKPWGMDSVLTEKYEWDIVEADSFRGFLLPMLEFDPLGRATAEECLTSSWFIEGLEDEEGEEVDGVNDLLITSGGVVDEESGPGS